MQSLLDGSRLMFDGQRLKDYECPVKYEMEDEDQIDCHYDPGEYQAGGC